MEVPDTFYYHRVSPETSERMTGIRRVFIGVAEVMMIRLPESRSRELALEHLEESCMRAIQCLALAEGEKIVE